MFFFLVISLFPGMIEPFFSGGFIPNSGIIRPIVSYLGTDKNNNNNYRKRDFIKNKNNSFISPSVFNKKKKYPYSNQYFENYIKRLNSQNISVRQSAILGEDSRVRVPKSRNERSGSESKEFIFIPLSQNGEDFDNMDDFFKGMEIKKSNNSFFDFEINLPIEEDTEEDYNIPEVFIISNNQKYPKSHSSSRRKVSERLQPFLPENDHHTNKKKQSDHFEILEKSPITFQDIGGYDNIKIELTQCIDILKNYTKYEKYNVRTPKGLILEGPPGNGKTLLAKGLAGEANASFIAVSGSEFQEKYVGIGAARVRELFELAKANIPCIIFLDEIDAIGRKRSNDGDSSNSERDSTLNQLLVNMDGFQSTSGIFIIGATNRADLLDPALIRPGRIDKRIYIGLPDSATRLAILNIHIRGKPHDNSIKMDELVELSQGLSASQLENLLNEAMLFAIRNGKEFFNQTDVESVMNRIMVGWQPTEHEISGLMLEKIAIHEMGHAIVGLLSKHHSKMTKVVINLSSPQSPGYTVFESSKMMMYTREALFEHLMILLAGRIAEEVFYNVSVTTGAINDFEEALKLAEKMVIYYGMGKDLIYPSSSEKYKERIDNEVVHLIKDAYSIAYFIVKNSKDIISECAVLLQKDKILKSEVILDIANKKYPNVLQLHN